LAAKDPSDDGSGGIGVASQRGATALRALADALVEAADLADAYDADPEAYNEREQGQRDPTE
jgi:hypothetical protein